jgi:hypothetical protein
MMAMLAGSKLAAHTLQLTVGSTSTLSQLFPAVPHIARFNLRSDAARAFLENADYHIASVSIPYALATHEDFVVEMLKFLKGNGVALQTGGRNIRAWNMHSVLFQSCGVSEPEEWLESFHVLREVRNCITHAGGSADSKLSEAIAAMGTGARAGWAAVNNGLAPESLIVGGRVALTAELIFQAFAITKRLGREINAALQSKLASAVWARMLVEDFAAQTSKAKNSDQWRRSLTGYASKHYSGMPIDAEELESAARELGVWTSARWPS